MKSLDYKIRVELSVALIVILIGVFFIIQAFTIKTSSEAIGPRTMPLFLAISLVVGGIWIGLRGILGKAGDIKEGYGFLESDVMRIFSVIGCGVFFLFTFWGFGYFTAILTTYIATLYSFGVRSWKWMIGGAIIIAFCFQIIFMRVMLLHDPAGDIIDMRPYTNWIKGE